MSLLSGLPPPDYDPLQFSHPPRHVAAYSVAGFLLTMLIANCQGTAPESAGGSSSRNDFCGPGKLEKYGVNPLAGTRHVKQGGKGCTTVHQTPHEQINGSLFRAVYRFFDWYDTSKSRYFHLCDA